MTDYRTGHHLPPGGEYGRIGRGFICIAEGLSAMLLQTTSYIVPKDKRVEHARLLRRFRQILMRLGCEFFEVYEQVGANWNPNQTTGRFVQILFFRDRKHYL